MSESTRLSVFMKRLRSGSVGRMFSLARDIHSECGKPTLFIVLDMVHCIQKYKIGYQEYRSYSFETTPEKNRKTYMNMYNNIALTRMLVDKSLYPILNDKGNFVVKYRDFLGGRDFVDLRKCTYEDYLSFCEKNKVFFAKPCDEFGGQGIEKVKIDEVQDLKEKYDKFIENKQFLLDAAVVQHEEMKKLCPTSLNTIRMVTIVCDDEKTHEKQPHFIYAIVRLGRNNAVVDNATSGGLYTLVSSSEDELSGELKYPCFCDKTGLTYKNHPDTGFGFIGFKIPFFKEAVDLVKRAAMVEPGLGYVGWDVGITENGPVLIEGNLIPGYDMPQSANWNPDRIGIKPKFEKMLGREMPTI